VVPKKSGFTVVKNERDELIPTRVQCSWRVCIDYRRLNRPGKTTSTCHSLTRCLSSWQVNPITIFLMVFPVIFKSILLLRTRKRPHSSAPLALLPIRGCLLAYAIPLAHSSGACSAFSVIFLKIAWRCLWMILLCMDPPLMNI